MIGIDIKKCTLCKKCIGACPFNAIELKNEGICFNSSCKMCKICIKACPEKALSFEEVKKEAVDKSKYRGILVYVEHYHGEIHPVTLELIGKASELTKNVGDDVYCLFIGHDIEGSAQKLLHYGVKKVFIYDYPGLEDFKVDAYANAFEDCINNLLPSIVLVGATSIGRSLAPKVATRFRTGLTADCTKLERRENTDLVQIRPAFGGNIMAQILTTNSRPQFATVRYKVMETAKRQPVTGEVVKCNMSEEKLVSRIEVQDIHKKEMGTSISEADVLVVAGRGIRDVKDLPMLEELASLLGGQLAATRPMIEAGLVHYTRQIGLSGRTVKPKLIIACGVSGAVQFTAGMNSSDVIVAINEDPAAPIFNIAHYGIVGDLYEIIPKLITKIKDGAKHHEL